MKRDRLSFSDIRRLRQSPLFAFLAAALLCGVLAGSFTGMHIPHSEGNYVNELAELVASNAIGQMPSIRTVLACFGSTFAWVVAAIVLGAISGRMLWISLLMAIRGFLLAFAVAAALVKSGWWGVYISIVSIGVSALLWIPAMLLLCSAVLDAGLGRRKQGYFAAIGEYSGAISCSMLLLIVSIFWRLLIVPILLGI